jgi:hypothetical protein
VVLSGISTHKLGVSRGQFTTSERLKQAEPISEKLLREYKLTDVNLISIGKEIQLGETLLEKSSAPPKASNRSQTVVVRILVRQCDWLK